MFYHFVNTTKSDFESDYNCRRDGLKRRDNHDITPLNCGFKIRIKEKNIEEENIEEENQKDENQKKENYFVIPCGSHISAVLNEVAVRTNKNIEIKKYRRGKGCINKIGKGFLEEIQKLPSFSEVIADYWDQEQELSDPNFEEYLFLVKDYSVNPEKIVGALEVNIDLQFKTLEISRLGVNESEQEKGYDEMLVYIAMLMASLHQCRYLEFESIFSDLDFYFKMGFKLSRESIKIMIKDEKIASCSKEELLQVVEERDYCGMVPIQFDFKDKKCTKTFLSRPEIGFLAFNNPFDGLQQKFNNSNVELEPSPPKKRRKT